MQQWESSPRKCCLRLIEFAISSIDCAPAGSLKSIQQL